MNASRPEADTEYSSPHRASGGLSDARKRYRRPALALALAGAVALLAAEFTPLLRVRTIARHPVLVRTVQTGPHHGWALVPIALLAAALSLHGARSSTRLVAPALALLGLAALGVTVLVDVPDAHATGLVGSTATGLHAAQAHAAFGLYLETVGAALLLLAAAADALLRPRRTAKTRGLPTARDRGLR
jgi:hypothetical protein